MVEVLVMVLGSSSYSVVQAQAGSPLLGTLIEEFLLTSIVQKNGIGSRTCFYPSQSPLPQLLVHHRVEEKEGPTPMSTFLTGADDRRPRDLRAACTMIGADLPEKHCRFCPLSTKTSFFGSPILLVSAAWGRRLHRKLNDGQTLGPN